MTTINELVKLLAALQASLNELEKEENKAPAPDAMATTLRSLSVRAQNLTVGLKTNRHRTLGERQMELASYLMAGAPALGLSAYPLPSACAAVGNATQESLCRPLTLGPKDHGSDGLFQWRLGRLTNLKSWCARNNLAWDTTKAQAWFFLYEMNRDYPALQSEMIAGKKPLKTLTANICKVFERPAAAEYTEVVRSRTRLEWRIKYAEDTLALMQGEKPTPSSPTEQDKKMNWISYLLPNKNQVTSGVRWGLSSLTAYLASRGWIGAETVDSIIGLTPLIASGIWSMLSHNQAGTIAAASSLAHNDDSGVLRVITTAEVANSNQFKADGKVVSQTQDGSKDFRALGRI